jgi:hypothetical protein
MTVLVREDLNESDLLWAAANLAVAGSLGQARRAWMASRSGPEPSPPSAEAPARGLPAAGPTGDVP